MSLKLTAMEKREWTSSGNISVNSKKVCDEEGSVLILFVHAQQPQRVALIVVCVSRGACTRTPQPTPQTKLDRIRSAKLNHGFVLFVEESPMRYELQRTCTHRFSSKIRIFVLKSPNREFQSYLRENNNVWGVSEMGIKNGWFFSPVYLRVRFQMLLFWWMRAFVCKLTRSNFISVARVPRVNRKVILVQHFSCCSSSSGGWHLTVFYPVRSTRIHLSIATSGSL